VCPTPTSLRRFYDAPNKPKPPWFWGPNQETVAVILSSKPLKHSCQFWGTNWETLHHLGFEAQPRNPTSFEVKSGETVATGFETKPEKTIATGFEAKLEKTIPVVLRPNHW
jgi:hypothetical protein